MTTELFRATGVVYKQDFQRWAAAVGDRNPLYFDADYARAHGYRDVIAPPLFLKDVTRGVVHLDEIAPDGIALSRRFGHLDLADFPRRMAAGERMTIHGPAYDGDVITAIGTDGGVVRKRGRKSGEFVLVTVCISYHNQDGTPVAEWTNTTACLS
jgi:acyl dehydratase